MKSGQSAKFKNSTIAVTVLGEFQMGEGGQFGIAQINVTEAGANNTDHVALIYDQGKLRVVSGLDPRYDFVIPCAASSNEVVESALLRYYIMQFDS